MSDEEHGIGIVSRQAVARVRALHQQYLPAFVDFYTCAHCNTLHDGFMVEPWPCPTIQALDGPECDVSAGGTCETAGEP